jgi:hypothetical protein
VIEQKISAASVDHGRRPSPTQPRPAASWAPTATSPTGRPPCRDGTFADLGRGREPGATHPATALGGVHAHTPRARRLQVGSRAESLSPKSNLITELIHINLINSGPFRDNRTSPKQDSESRGRCCSVYLEERGPEG